ncbi:hypothetical protein SAMN04487857_106177 [Pseudomonas sp. ok272]|uniref:hypothetical protein n=1 Tax=unclassified Pseudomonas TaxID=196821 RepID=UPI0008D5AFBE|nr:MULTISPECIES: hypothetical protein [unclassified Pseudomonas]SEM88817.1 hypothetical protein SAMN04487857_106177 [Pseudomonas sp. ok272]SFM74507.1 hypothetical protein SAMN04487858_10645 [Pseudomonas sp. ok602]
MTYDMRIVPSVKERLEFLDAIKLPATGANSQPVERAASVQAFLTDDRAAGAVLLGGTLLSYMEGLTRAEKKEIKNSVRIAQLMSDSYKDERRDLASWVDLYCKALNHVGWYTDRQPGEKRYTDFSSNISQKMLDTVAVLGGEPMLDNSLAAFTALKKNRSGLLEYAKASLWGKAFQTIPAGRDSQGRITLVFNHARLEAQQDVDDFLFFQWRAGSAVLRHNYLSFNLDRDAYAKTREKIEGILDDDDMNEIDLRLELLSRP